jgi:tight adherence protein B
MILLIIGVVTILCLAFGLLVVATTQPDLHKAVRQRLAAIPAAENRLGQGPPDAPQFLKEAGLAPAGWLHALLNRLAGSEKLRRYIAQGNSSQTVQNVFLLSLGLGIAGFVLALLFAPALPIEILAGCALASLPSLQVVWRRSRRIASFAAGLPEAVDMMARSLRAGHSMAAAIEIVSLNSIEPTASEFGQVFQQQNFGLPLREALTQLLDRVPSQDLRILVTAILVQRETGGNLVELLDRTAFILRDRLRIHGEIRIHTAQGRMTGWVLSLLPVIMLILINLLNPGYSRILFTDPFGRKLLYGGAALIVAGALIINRIVNGIEV